MSSAQNSTDKEIDDKTKKIAALRDLADVETGILKKQKQDVVKKIKVDKDQSRLAQLREKLGLIKNIQ